MTQLPNNTFDSSRQPVPQLPAAPTVEPLEFCRRQYYRLRYPENDRPFVQIGDQCFPVTEISEGGMRFSCETQDPFDEGRFIAGSIRFRDGAIVAIYAHVTRRSENEVVLVFRPNIAFARVMKEQCWISRKYLRIGDA